MKATVTSGLAALMLLAAFFMPWNHQPIPSARAEDAKPTSQPDWPTILGPSQAVLPLTGTGLPGLSDKVIWETDLPAAMARAQKENRPLFVTLRCLPCKQCAAFDKDVLEGGPDLDPLLKQFVTVRLIDARAADLRIFPVQGFQDLDLSWWGYFLSPAGKVYGVFGGRDEVSDATRISKPALIATLRRVLNHHYDPRAAAWNIDGPAPDLHGSVLTASDLPGYVSWSQHTKLDPRTAQAGCVHCHQVSEILREPAIRAKTFDKDHDLQIWPLPENVGVKVDRDDGLKVTEVIPGSPAEKAGLRAGDSLAAAGSDGTLRLLYGQADFRGVLHRAPHGAATIDMYWLRDGKPIAGHLVLADGWRKTVLDWRKSIANGNIGAGPAFWPLKATSEDRKRLSVPENSMLVKVLIFPGPAKDAGLAANEWVTAVDGQKPDVSDRAFLIWFRLHHEIGDSVTLTLAEPGGQTKAFTYKVQ